MTTKKIALIGCLILLGVAAFAAWRLVPESRFEERVERLRKQGQPVAMGDLNLPLIVAPSENGATLFLEACAWYERFEKSGTLPSCLHLDRRDWTEENWADVARFVAECAPFIDLLERGAARPAYHLDVNWEEGPSAVLSTVALAQQASEVLQKRAILAARAGANPQRALDSLLLMLDVADRQERFNALPYRVRLTVYGVAAATLKEIVVSQGQGFDARRARTILDRRLSAMEEPGLLEDALRGERAMGLWVIGRMLRGESLDGEDPGFARVLSWFERPRIYAEGCRYLDRVGELIEAVGEPYPAVHDRLAMIRQRIDESGAIESLTRLACPTLVDAHDERARVTAATRLARIGLALLEQRQETGAWPEDLASLAGWSEGGLPADPATGGRFRYERTATGIRLSATANAAIGDHHDARELVWEIAAP